MTDLRVRGGILLVAALAIAAGACNAASEPISPNAIALNDAWVAGGGGSATWSTDLEIRAMNSGTAELYADLMLTSVTAQRAFSRAIPSIAEYGRSDRAAPDGRVSATCCSPGNRWTAWGTPYFARETRKRDGGYLGYEQNFGGFAAGVGRMLGNAFAVGLALGSDHRRLSFRDGYHMKERADAFHAALYGGATFGCFFVDGYAGYSRDWQRTERNSYDSAGPLYAVALGNFNNTVLSAGLKVGSVWTLPGGVCVTPAVGLDYSHVRMGGFDEKVQGGGGNVNTLLGVGASRFNSLSMPITVSAGRTFATDFLAVGGHQTQWTPEVRGGWVPRFGAGQTSVDAVFQKFGPSPTPFKSRSTPLARSYGTAGAGLKVKLGGRHVLAVDYEYTWASKYSKHLVAGTYGVAF